jgi:hypothetical protein
MIGGAAPSDYLKRLEQDKAVQLLPEAMDDILRGHYISPDLLRSDDFRAFFDDRRRTLLDLIETAIGKPAEMSETGDHESFSEGLPGEMGDALNE